ncbi:hypothetical protein GQ53DRAFT_371250 [Thozetella sp. PMI_491]|nr:hypothetical protein GQ53DRAFT_371250 [Thozetella sp. PMI_491]
MSKRKGPVANYSNVPLHAAGTIPAGQALGCSMSTDCPHIPPGRIDKVVSQPYCLYVMACSPAQPSPSDVLCEGVQYEEGCVPYGSGSRFCVAHPCNVPRRYAVAPLAAEVDRAPLSPISRSKTACATRVCRTADDSLAGGWPQTRCFQGVCIQYKPTPCMFLLARYEAEAPELRA